MAQKNKNSNNHTCELTQDRLLDEIIQFVLNDVDTGKEEEVGK